MKRFWRADAAERRPLLNCCSVSVSISCCSLPAVGGVLVTAVLIWLGLRFSEAARRRLLAETAAA